MRDYLTIGELAKMMNVSIHQIRYFEEKGILLPFSIDRNGYRLYGLNEIYNLAHILLLRKFNISVKDIKMCFTNYTTNDYKQLLGKTVDDLNEQIGNLTSLRDFTIGIIDKMSRGDLIKDKYIKKSIAERNLCQICKMKHQQPFSVKRLYDNFNKYNSSFNLYETDIISFYGDIDVYMCVEVNENNSNIKHKLIAGDYLSYSFIISNEKDFIAQVDKFFKYIEENRINTKGRLIVIENSMLSICYSNQISYEFQMLIK